MFDNLKRCKKKILSECYTSQPNEYIQLKNTSGLLFAKLGCTFS